MSVKQYRWISPVRTLILLWVIVLTGTRLAPERLLYATWGNSRLLSQSGAIALIGCIGFFIMGAISYDFMIKKQRRLLFQYRVPSLEEIKVGLNLISWGTWLILPILIYWLYITFRDLGGIGAWSRVFEGTRLPGGVRSLFELNEPLGGSETLVTTLTALLICCAGYKGYLRANNHINFKAINKRASFLLAILFALLLCYVLFSSTRVFFCNRSSICPRGICHYLRRRGHTFQQALLAYFIDSGWILGNHSGISIQ